MSPAIGAGANPENLFADQRGYGVPSGTTWDIGAYQTQAVADSTATHRDLAGDQRELVQRRLA